MRKIVIYVLAAVAAIFILNYSHSSKNHGSYYGSRDYCTGNYYNSSYYGIDKVNALPNNFVMPSLKRNDSILSILKSELESNYQSLWELDYSHLFRDMDTFPNIKLRSSIYDDNNFSSELSFDVQELKFPETSLSDLKLEYETTLRTKNLNNTLTCISSFDPSLPRFQRFESKIHIDSIAEDNFSIPSDSNVQDTIKF